MRQRSADSVCVARDRGPSPPLRRPAKQPRQPVRIAPQPGAPATPCRKACTRRSARHCLQSRRPHAYRGDGGQVAGVWELHPPLLSHEMGFITRLAMRLLFIGHPGGAIPLADLSGAQAGPRGTTFPADRSRPHLAWAQHA